MKEGCRALGVKNAGLETGLFELPSEHGEVFVTCLEVSCHQMGGIYNAFCCGSMRRDMIYVAICNLLELHMPFVSPDGWVRLHSP